MDQVGFVDKSTKATVALFLKKDPCDRLIMPNVCFGLRDQGLGFRV